MSDTRYWHGHDFIAEVSVVCRYEGYSVNSPTSTFMVSPAWWDIKINNADH